MVFGLFRQLSDLLLIFATKNKEITIQSKCFKYKASQFVGFKKTGCKFMIAPLVDM